jgi:hypothetical protein
VRLFVIQLRGCVVGRVACSGQTFQIKERFLILGAKVA